MVLDTLGNSLKNTLKKIAQAVFVNDKLLDELVREIQRALLQADVDVKLVFELTNTIKQRAKDDKPPAGVTQREYLVTIVYQELVKFFGEEKKGITLTKKKPFKIMMLGLYGSGKCVHKDSTIPLSDGNIISAEELYNSYSMTQKPIDDGHIIDISDISDRLIHVPSFNPHTLKMENKKVTHLWKLHGKPLLNVYLDNGNDFGVRVTPEHPFFVLRKGVLQQIRADQLTEDDFVALPAFSPATGTQQCLFDSLKTLNLDIKHPFDKSNINIRQDILPKLFFKRNYCKLTTNLKKGIQPICLVDDYIKDYLTIKERNAHYFIHFPTYLTEDLAEFVGYIMGDGHLEKNYVQISNEDPEIIERVNCLAHELFNLKVTSKKDERTKSTYHLIIASKTLVTIFNKVFGIPIGKKGKCLSIPSSILKSDSFISRAFLRAYFDCDASPAFNSRAIELSSESNILIKQTASLLHRFGILSTISRKFVDEIPYWRLSLQARYAELYASQIGFSIKHKKERVDSYALIGILQGCGKRDMIPLGNSLKDLRHSLGFSIGEIQHYVNSYGIYEKTGEISKENLAKLVALYSLKKLGNVASLLSHLKNPQAKLNHNFINGFIPLLRKEGFIHEDNNLLLLTSKATLYLQNIGSNNSLLTLFKLLAEADVRWSRVKKILPQQYDDFVYDLTVEDNHSFIADNIIVHNTTTIGKLAKYYQKRGHKVAVVGLDVHRPAAPLQLQQLADQLKIPAFIDPKEKNALKVWNKHKDNYGDFDILLVDTAGRDALDKDLITEIEEVNKAVQADERLLVLSADIGQAAKKQAQQFHDSCGVTGVIITKLDGTAKGGGSLSACAATQAPIKFIGVGEKMEDLEEFNPAGFVGRLLGMGDVEALLEKAKEAMTEEQAEDLSKKMLQGDFSLIDLHNQLSAMRKMGPLNKIMEMIPGMGKLQMPKEALQVQEEKITLWRFILDSCTKKELEHPEVLTKSRLERIAKGAGVQVRDIRDLLKQYNQSKKFMKMMKGKNPEKMMQKFGAMKFK